MTRVAVCPHDDLITDPAAHVDSDEYKLRSRKELATAAGLSYTESDYLHFPYPLVLPGDDLAQDPEYPPQTVRDWLRDPDRNEVTPDRNVIYISGPPNASQDAQFIHSWTACAESSRGSMADITPNVQDVMDYLEAFYHGMPVRRLPQPLTFSAWTTGVATARAANQTPRYIGLDTHTERIRVRTRACPDKTFKRQLNSDDILDAALAVLPADAYALLVLVQHDLWEGAEDVFICGRAYGASRIAVVSSARYCPALDERQGVERLHAWPASHCAAYAREQCAAVQPSAPKRKKRKTIPATSLDSTANLATADSPLHAAVAAYVAHVNSESDAGLWLSRVCRTAAHELGHCFGFDHCVFRACSMQGSACVQEDARQPLYLCPVDQAKVDRATGQTDGGHSRDQALLRFCRRHENGSALFAAYAAWINCSVVE